MKALAPALSMNPVAAGVSPAVEGARPRRPEKLFENIARSSAGQDARLYGRPEARRYVTARRFMGRNALKERRASP
jgi:hypothetical protein